MRRILAAALFVLAFAGHVAADPLLTINTGQGPNDRTGDSVRDAFIKTMNAVNGIGNSRGSPNGLATLGPDGLLSPSQVPSIIPPIGPITANNLDPQAVSTIQVSPQFCPYGQLNGLDSNNACVQSAIDYACSLITSPNGTKVGGKLVMGRANYRLTGTNIPKSCPGLTIEGQGGGGPDGGTVIYSDQACTGPIFNFYPDATQDYIYGGGGVRNIHFYNNKPFGGAFDGTTSCLNPLIRVNFGRNMTFEHLTTLSPATFIKLVGGHHYIIKNIAGDQALAGNNGVFEFFGYGATGSATSPYRLDVVDLSDVSFFGAAAGAGLQLYKGIWIHGFASSVRTNNVAFVNTSTGLKIDCTASEVALALRPAEIGACPAFGVFNDLEIEASGSNAVDITDAQNLQFNYLYAACYARTSTANPSTSGCNAGMTVKNTQFSTTGNITVNGGIINNAQGSGIDYEGYMMTLTGGLQLYGNNAANVGTSNLTVEPPVAGKASGSHIVQGVKFCSGPGDNGDNQRAASFGAGNDYVVFIGNVLKGCSFNDPGTLGSHSQKSPNAQ